jgi:hypothetical protein
MHGSPHILGHLECSHLKMHFSGHGGQEVAHISLQLMTIYFEYTKQAYKIMLITCGCKLGFCRTAGCTVRGIGPGSMCRKFLDMCGHSAVELHTESYILASSLASLVLIKITFFYKSQDKNLSNLPALYSLQYSSTLWPQSAATMPIGSQHFVVLHSVPQRSLQG